MTVHSVPTLHSASSTFESLPVIGFVTLLHGLTPRLGVYVMNVSRLDSRGPLCPDAGIFAGLELVQDRHPSVRRHHRLGRPLWPHSHPGPARELPQRVRRQLEQQ